MFLIKRNTVKASSSTEGPLLNSECECVIVAEQEIFGDHPLGTKLSLTVGNISGYYGSVLNECLSLMKNGETSTFVVSFQKVDSEKPAEINFTLELLSHTEGKHVHELSVNERIQVSEKWKICGNSHFKSNDICMAGYWYSKALKTLLSCFREDINADLKDKHDSLLCQCRINLAAVQLKSELYQHAIENCTHALDIDSRLIKALFRRAQAKVSIGDDGNAIADLKRALKLDPNSLCVRNLLKTTIEGQKEKEK